VPDEQGSLGDAVRSARRSAGLSLTQLSAMTRIRVAILEDLEAGRTDSSGGSVYARGHLRAIAAATLTEPDDLLAAHDRRTARAVPVPPPAGSRRSAGAGRPATTRSGRAAAASQQPAEGVGPPPATRPATTGPALPGRPVRVSTGGPARPSSRPSGPRAPESSPGDRSPAATRRPSSARPASGPRRARRGSAARPDGGSLRLPAAAAPERRGPRWGVALGVVVAALAALTAVGLRQPDPGPEPAPTLAAAPSSSPSASRPTPDPSAVARVPSPTGAALRLRAVDGSSWVNVSGSGGKTLFRGVLRKGTAKDFTDRTRLRVTVGDAGAVDLICGGKDAPAGGRGAVRRYTCARGGFVTS